MAIFKKIANFFKPKTNVQEVNIVNGEKTEYNSSAPTIPPHHRTTKQMEGRSFRPAPPMPPSNAQVTSSSNEGIPIAQMAVFSAVADDTPTRSSSHSSNSYCQSSYSTSESSSSSSIGCD